MNRIQRRMLWASLLAGSLVISLLSLVFFASPLKHIVLFFPTAGHGQLHSEIHAIPRHNDPIKEVEETIRSLINGPLSMKFKRIVPAQTNLRAIYELDGRIVVDLSSAAQIVDLESPLAIEKRIDLLRLAITQNFSIASNITILIQGQEIYSVPYVPARKS